MDSDLPPELLSDKAKEHGTAIAADIGELLVDSLLTEGPIKDVPILGTFVKMIGAGLEIRDRLFAQKLWNFISEIKGADAEKRSAFIEELATKEGSRSRAGSAILLIIDRLDNQDKPSLVGRICLSRIKGDISYDEMRRFCMIVERSYLPDLIAVNSLDTDGKVDPIAAPLFASLGVAFVTGEDYGTFDGTGAETWHELTPLGRKLLSTIFPR